MKLKIKKIAVDHSSVCVFSHYDNCKQASKNKCNYTLSSAGPRF
jgi:hypothetical protein